MKNKEFPNGLISYLETYYEIVSEITKCLTENYPKLGEIYEFQGRGGLYELAESLTDKFETTHKGKVWDGDFFDIIDKFLEEELYNEDK